MYAATFVKIKYIVYQLVLGVYLQKFHLEL